MRVFGANTSAGTYLAFRPFSPLGFHPLSRKRSLFRPLGLLASPARRM